MIVDKNSTALFISVIDNKSFSKAAKKENVPVSTISRKISELEKTFGVRLLERTTRKLRATPIGQEYYDNCVLAVNEINTANELVSNRGKQISGTLKISVPPSISDTIIMPLILDFQKLYPEVNIECFVSEKNVNYIHDDIDLSLRVGDLKDSNLVARLIWQYTDVLVASPKYIKENGMPQHPRDLLEHKIITFLGHSQVDCWVLKRDLEECKVKISPIVKINDFIGIQSAVIGGNAIAVIPSIISAQKIEEGKLVVVLPEWNFPKMKISVVYQSNRNLSKTIRLFRDFCVDHFPKKINTFQCTRVKNTEKELNPY